MGTVADKLTYLNNTKQGLKNVINYTGAGIDNNTTFRDYEEKLYNGYLDILKDNGETLFNNLPKVTGEGTNITLNNTANSKMKVELEPSELEQESTTGKNLAPINWASDFVNAVNNTNLADIVTKDSRDCLKYEPSAGYNDYDNKNLAIGLTFEENTQYTISFDMLKENAYNETFAIYYTDGTHTLIGDISIGIWTHKKLTSDANKTIKYIAPYYTSGTTYIDLNTWQIEKGTNETTYEKPTNGASPSPDYPQEIHTISGDNEIVVGNINIWDEEWEVGSLNYSTGVKENDESRIRSKNYISVKPNTTYYLLGGNGSGRECFYDKNKNHISSASVYNKTFTTPNNAYYMMFTTAQGYGNTYKNDICINVSNENINGTYYSHQEQTLPLNLDDLEYCKIGDYEDEFVIPDENLLNINRALGTPSDTSYANTTKRLFNYNEYIVGISGNNYYYSNYITSYNLSNNNITINTQANGYGLGFPVKVEANETYTLSYSISASANQNVRVGFYSSDGTWLSQTISTETNNYLNITTPNNCDFMVIVFTPPANTETTYSNIMLNEGSTTLPYEPYDNGKWYLKKNIGKYTLPNASSLSNTTAFGINCKFTPYLLNNALSGGRNYNFYCDRIHKANEQYSQYAAYRNSNQILVLTDIDDTLENFNSKIAGSTVLYQLATPTYILLNDTLQTQLNNIQKALSYNDQTNVSQVNNDLPFRLRLSAIKKYTE